jgi:regulator of protease activity HflC (stomatin/prohibitin superfamily)
MFQVHILDSFNSGEETKHWSERVTRQASKELISEISRFNLDSLFQPDETGALPVEIIKKRVKRRLEKAFNGHGIEIVSVGVGQFILSEDVLAQRILNWKAQWQVRAEAEESAGQAEVLRRIALAKARAQIEIIERITDSIEIMRGSTTADLGNIVSLRMFQALEEAAKDDAVKAMVPKQAMDTWQQVNSWLRDLEESV